MSNDLRQRLEVAATVAGDAGKITERDFQTRMAVTAKPDGSPVTRADVESERLIQERLMAAFPGDGFLGEECGELRGTTGFLWVVDPLDGTKSFIHGVPLYGSLIGLEDPRGDAVLGVAFFPALGDLIMAARGEGCFWNGAPCGVSSVKRLEDSCLVFTGLDNFDDQGVRGELDKLQRRVRLARGWGDCYGHMLVATGRAEIMLDPILSDWDSVALLPILEEAGGTFTDWKGNRTARGRSGISTNGRVQSSLMAVLSGR